MDGPSASAPVLSLILPVYNAKPYLEGCLDSILNQNFRSLEVIAVDGASDDGSAQELTERAGSEPRLTVLRDEDRIGPGTARNRGASQARGEYLWFVDADDVIAADCVGSVVDAVKATEPDVLFVGYEVVQRWRKRRPSPVHGLPPALAGVRFTIADHPEVLNFSVASWNKVVRREYFVKQGLGFEKQWPHEDVRLSAQLLLEADSLSALDKVCYRYRRNRPGSAMRGPDARRHFKAFKAWQLVLDWAQIRAKVDDPLVTCGVYRTLFERAIYHYSTLLDTRGYVPRQHRREFFGQMNADFTKYAPPDYQPAAGLRGIKLKLIRDGNYGRYALLDPVNRVRNGLKTAVAFCR